MGWPCPRSGGRRRCRPFCSWEQECTVSWGFVKEEEMTLSDSVTWVWSNCFPFSGLWSQQAKQNSLQSSLAQSLLKSWALYKYKRVLYCSLYQKTLRNKVTDEKKKARVVPNWIPAWVWLAESATVMSTVDQLAGGGVFLPAAHS